MTDENQDLHVLMFHVDHSAAHHPSRECVEAARSGLSTPTYHSRRSLHFAVRCDARLAVGVSDCKAVWWELEKV